MIVSTVISQVRLILHLNLSNHYNAKVNIENSIEDLKQRCNHCKELLEE